MTNWYKQKYEVSEYELNNSVVGYEHRVQIVDQCVTMQNYVRGSLRCRRNRSCRICRLRDGTRDSTNSISTFVGFRTEIINDLRIKDPTGGANNGSCWRKGVA